MCAISDLCPREVPSVGPNVKTQVPPSYVRTQCPPHTSINLALYGLTKLFRSKILQWMLIGLIGLMALKVSSHRITHYLFLLRSPSPSPLSWRGQLRTKYNFRGWNLRNYSIEYCQETLVDCHRFKDVADNGVYNLTTFCSILNTRELHR